jgi:hypothetical protein
MINAEDPDRTTPIGMFNYGESYWRAACTLKEQELRTTHSDAPISLLYYHAIELYLKSLLRSKGYTPAELRARPFGHDSAALASRCDRYGLGLANEDKEVCTLMGKTDAVMQARYIRTGAFRVPTHGALDKTCRSLRQLIGKDLSDAGHPVRLLRRWR